MVLSKIAAIIFSILFSWQFLQSITKLQLGDTIMVTTIEERESLELPMLTICKTGLKHSWFKHMHYITNDFESTCGALSIKKEDWLECYEEILHGKSDIIRDVHISVQDENGDQPNATFKPLSWNIDAIFIPNSPYSICIRTEFEDNIEPGPVNNLHLKLNFGRYDVYIHDQKFMLLSTATNTKLNQLAQFSFEVSQSIGNEHYYSLEKKEWQLMDKTGDRCNPDPDYSFFNCWKSFAAKNLSCQFPIHPLNSLTPNCSSYEDYKTFQHFFKKQVYKKSKDLEELTGCLAPCKFSSYTINKDLQLKEKRKLQKTSYIYRKDAYASVLLSYPNGKVPVVKEKLLYDGFAFVGEVGGSLGLFLGASMLSMTIFLMDFMVKRVRSALPWRKSSMIQ